MSNSDYSKIYDAYIDNTRINCPKAKESFAQPSVDDFKAFIYKIDPLTWTDCVPGMIQQNDKVDKIYPLSFVNMMMKNLGVTNVMIKETPNSYFMVRLCPSGSILTLPSSNYIRSNNNILDSDGNSVPFTNTTFSLPEKTRKTIGMKLLYYLETARKWSSCNTTDMFQQFVSSLEIDESTDFSKIVGYKFDKMNENPHIIQLIDMCRDMLRLKYEVSYFSRNKKIVFHKLCRANVEKNILSKV